MAVHSFAYHVYDDSLELANMDSVHRKRNHFFKSSRLFLLLLEQVIPWYEL